eukprot:754978-Hanusia_phi.AAC.9
MTFVLADGISIRVRNDSPLLLFVVLRFFIVYGFAQGDQAYTSSRSAQKDRVISILTCPISVYDEAVQHFPGVMGSNGDDGGFRY